MKSAKCVRDCTESSISHKNRKNSRSRSASPHQLYHHHHHHHHHQEVVGNCKRSGTREFSFDFFPRNMAAMLCGTVLNIQNKTQICHEGQRITLTSELLHSTFKSRSKKIALPKDNSQNNNGTDRRNPRPAILPTRIAFLRFRNKKQQPTGP